MFLFSVILTHTANEWNSLNHENSHEKPTRKNFGSTKYPQETILDPQNTREEIHIKAQWHDSTRPMRPTVTQDPRNLAHSR